jgi:hypothetical protein
LIYPPTQRLNICSCTMYTARRTIESFKIDIVQLAFPFQSRVRSILTGLSLFLLDTNTRIYAFSGYIHSLRLMPNSSLTGSSSCRYSSYWCGFSTLDLIPAGERCQHLSSRRKNCDGICRMRRMLINSSSQLGIRTLKDPDRSGKIVDAARSSQRSSDNGR